MIQAIGAIGLGSLLTALVGGLFLMRKTRAESGKLDADAAQTIAAAAASLVAPLSAQVGALEQRIVAVEREHATTRARFASAIRHIRDWIRWDTNGRVGLSPSIPEDLRDEV